MVRFLTSKIFSNSLWMMLEKFVAIFGLIFVNAYMAKYVGPESYGKIVFASTVFLFVQNIGWFGAQNVYFKRMSERPTSGLKFAFATLNNRRILFFMASIFSLAYLYLTADFIVFVFGIANFIASYFLVSDIYTLYNNSQLTSYINALSNIIGLTVALVVRFFQVYYDCHIYYMAIPIVLIALIPYCIRYFIFNKTHNANCKLINKKRYNKYLFHTGGALFLSSLSIIFYTQISNIFLAKYATYQELAYYNVAMTLGSAWSFVNIALITSFFSKIFATKDSEESKKYYLMITYIVFLISVCAYIFFYFSSDFIVAGLYGGNFQKSSDLIGLIVVATFFSGIGTINYRYMMKYGAYRYLSIKMILVAFFSIMLSYLLIKNYQSTGAAWCFILVELISATIANYFFAKGQILKLNILLFRPCRLIRYIRN